MRLKPAQLVHAINTLDAVKTGRPLANPANESPKLTRKPAKAKKK
jgi:hypothetical protein